MSNISITVPTGDEKALTAAANMLLTLANRKPASIYDEPSTINPVNEPGDGGALNDAPEPAKGPTDGWPSGANPIDIDEAGLPWDTRIHASTKTKTAKGLWKKRKGVDADTITDVEAELHELMAIPVSGQTQQEQQPVIIPPPQQEQTAGAPTTFAEFVKACGAKISAGQLTMPRILEIVNGKGIQSLQAVGTRSDLIPELWSEINAL